MTAMWTTLINSYLGDIRSTIPDRIHSESRFRLTWQIEYINDVMFYVVFGPTVHILILLRCCLFAAVITIDVFFVKIIIVSTHRRRHIASEVGFKHDSPNPDSDSLTNALFY